MVAVAHDDTYPGQQVRPENIWLMMTATLNHREAVHIVDPDERRRYRVYQQVTYHGFDQSNIETYVFPTNDVWARHPSAGAICLSNRR